MKTLLMFRHSLKDGVRKDTIGPKGFALAIAQGEQLVAGQRQIHAVAHGPLLRTQQTLLAMLSPFGEFFDDRVRQEVHDFGSDDLFALITGKQGFREKAKEAGNFGAVIATASEDELAYWKHTAKSGILEAFDNVERDETGLAVGHSPIIELALSSIFGELSPEFATLNEMDGVELQMDSEGNIALVGKISAPVINPSRHVSGVAADVMM